MKRKLTKTLALTLALLMAVLTFVPAPVSAAEEEVSVISASAENDYEPVAWYPSVKSNTKTFTGKTGNKIIANCYYERIVLVGFRKGISKINKALKKVAKKVGYANITEVAQEMAEESMYSREILYDTTSMDVSYIGEKYISLTTSRYWYGGGVSNTFEDGYVYDLDTGKKKTITDVTGLSESEIKGKIIAALKTDNDVKEYGSMVDELVNSTKVKDINFCIDLEGNIIILIPPYTEPFFGGWSRTFRLDGVYVK